MRSRTCVLWLSILCVCTMSAFASDQSAVGTWKLNVQKSSSGTMPAPKFEQLNVSTDKPNELAWSLKGMSADGKSYISSYSGPIDGQYHPVMGSTMGHATIAYTRKGANVSWTMKGESGSVIETGRGELAPDGNTLVLKGTVEGPKGKTNYVSVFERTQ